MWQRALLDQLLQPLTANAPWQWWSETPIVLGIAKNTRCVIQWLLNLLAWELSQCLSSTGLLYLLPSPYKQGYPFFLVLCQLAIVGTSLLEAEHCRYPATKCTTASSNSQMLGLLYWPGAYPVLNSFLVAHFSQKCPKRHSESVNTNYNPS